MGDCYNCGWYEDGICRLEYRIIWNDGQVDRFPAEVYSLQEIRDLRNAIILATKGAYKGRIDLVEVNK